MAEMPPFAMNKVVKETDTYVSSVLDYLSKHYGEEDLGNQNST